MIRFAKRRKSWAAGLLLVGLSACSGANTPVHYYVLSSVPRNSASGAGGAGGGPIVNVAPVILPAYLDQPGITTHERDIAVARSEFDRWAGPLNSEITRAVAENLSVMIPTDRLTDASTGRSIPSDFLVQIEIGEFARDEANTVQLVARWAVFTHDGDTLIAMRTSRISKPASAADYGSTVAAMSGAVEDLCREITAVIKAVEKPAPTPRPAANRRS